MSENNCHYNSFNFIYIHGNNFQFFMIFFYDNVNFKPDINKINQIKQMKFRCIKKHSCRLWLIVKAVNKVNEFIF